jgi:hypothetical protein
MNNNRTKAAVIGGTLAAGAALALLSPAAPAMASASGLDITITVQSPGTLVARGAAVDVTMDVTCAVREPGAYVKLSERVGNWLVTGEGYAPMSACTGSPQRVVVRVMAQGDRPFAMGTALATGSVSGCDEFYTICSGESQDATIKIIK